jgi:hypothetical protein
MEYASGEHLTIICTLTKIAYLLNIKDNFNSEECYTMLSGYLVTTEWCIFRLRVEEAASRNGK